MASDQSDTATAESAVAPLTRPTPVALGQVLGGRYTLTAHLGRGGSGVVYLAFDQLARVQVAVKALETPSWFGTESSEQLFRELRFGRAVQDANVCRIHDVLELQGRCFLTMEYASGGTLRATILEHGAGRPPADKLGDARAVIAGLAAIHRAGLVHRDLKPENILRTGDGRLVVSDFGITRALTHTATTRRLVGTPGYLAPETRLGVEPSPAADVWSLGVVLHEILAGCRPQWIGASWRARLPRHADWREEALARVCRACLLPEPARRPGTGAAVQALLERHLRRRFRLGPRLRRVAWVAAAAGLLLSGAAMVRTTNRRWGAVATPCSPDAREVCRLAGGACERWPDSSEHCRWPLVTADRCGLAAARPMDPPNQGTWTTASRPGGREGPGACLAPVRDLCARAEWQKCRYLGAIACENFHIPMCRWRSDESDCNTHTDKSCWGIWTPADQAEGSPRNGVPRDREGACIANLTNLTGKACL